MSIKYYKNCFKPKYKVVRDDPEHEVFIEIDYGEQFHIVDRYNRIWFDYEDDWTDEMIYQIVKFTCCAFFDGLCLGRTDAAYEIEESLKSVVSEESDKIIDELEFSEGSGWEMFQLDLSDDQKQTKARLHTRAREAG